MGSDFPLVLSVTSGKGGVGKTNIAVNLACCLADFGKRVVLLDADLGLANVDIVLGMTPQKNLSHVFSEGLSLNEIMVDTPYGFRILPASSGVTEMLTLTTGQKLELLEAVDALEHAVDYFIVDTGAGIHDTVMYFNLAVQERLVVLTPEPTSLTDAYALIKIMHTKHNINSFRVLVNMAQDTNSGKEIFIRLHMACEHFLKSVSLDLIGIIPRDTSVRKAVINQKPFCIEDAKSSASLAIRDVAKEIQAWAIPESLDGNIKFFWKKFLFRQ